MACCKCCCGGVDCTEGQQGKCCCGGSTGECCSDTEYCCDGACQCGQCDCPSGGLCYECDSNYSTPRLDVPWGGGASPTTVIDCCDPCPYSAQQNGYFSCTTTSGDCNWFVSVCADIECNTIDPDTQCGSDCTVTNITLTVDCDTCDCPAECDTSTIDYLYCPP